MNPIIVTARASGVIAYLALGICVGVWSGSLPTLTEHYGLSPTNLAALLVAFRLSGIAAMQVAGRAADRQSALHVAAGGMVAVAATWLTVGWVPLATASFLVLLVVAAGAGAALGVLDVATNSHAVDVDAQYPTSLLGRLHACFSVGALVGSGLILAGAYLNLPAISGRALVFTVVGALVLGAWWLFRAASAPVKAAPQHSDGTSGPVVMWPFVGMAICVGIGEGAAFDWSSLHVKTTGAVPEKAAAMGLMCVAVAMIAARFSSDLLVSRWGRRACVRVAALIGVLGYACTAMPAASSAVVLLGWLLVGAGAGSLAPQVYGAAGQVGGGSGMALVVGGGYTGIVLGPMLLGPAVQWWGVSVAMVIPLLAVAVLGWLSGWLPERVGASGVGFGAEQPGDGAAG